MPPIYNYNLINLLNGDANLLVKINYLGTFDFDLDANILAALMTCGQRFSIWEAAYRTIFTPSSFPDMEQAKLATWN